jgi:hypothetical protein
MARAKSVKAKPVEPTPVEPTPAPPKGANNNILSIRGTPEWRAWLERFASKSRVTPTAMLDLAVAEKAARDGFEPPPPRF